MAGAPDFHKQKEWDALFDRVAKLEQENENLKKGLAFAISMGVRASGMFYHKPDGEEYVWPGVGNFTKELGIPPWTLQLSKDKIEIKFDNEEENDEQADKRTDPSQSV